MRWHVMHGRHMVIFVATLSIVAGSVVQADDALPAAKPVPAVQVIPLPYHQASFQHRGRELTRYHFGPTLMRPFCYPVIGPAGRSLTRMGHPHDPITHSHHNSVWISHNDVAGTSFWDDRGAGRIVHQRIEQYADGETSAWLLATAAWKTREGKTLLVERRRVEVQPTEGADRWLMIVDLQLETPGNTPVTLGQTPFGMIGVRMAKTIGVHDGGGRILNSQGQRDEANVFRKPARWVDYSGPVTPEQTGGVTLLDHPSNPGHPSPFHVRNDGWMGACLTLDKPLVIEPGRPLRLRWGLWMHDGVPKAGEIEQRWQTFSGGKLPPMQRVRE